MAHRIVSNASDKSHSIKCFDKGDDNIYTLIQL